MRTIMNVFLRFLNTRYFELFKIYEKMNNFWFFFIKLNKKVIILK